MKFFSVSFGNLDVREQNLGRFGRTMQSELHLGFRDSLFFFL